MLLSWHRLRRMRRLCGELMLFCDLFVDLGLFELLGAFGTEGWAWEVVVRWFLRENR